MSAQPAGRFTKLAPPAEKKGPNSECKKLAPGLEHVVRTSKETGAWGYMADGLVPAAIIRSGDVVNLTIPSAAGTLLYGVRNRASSLRPLPPEHPLPFLFPSPGPLPRHAPLCAPSPCRRR